MVNNNPGNIRLIANLNGTMPKPFNGEVRPGDMKTKWIGFRKFDGIDSGLRAMYLTLYNNYLLNNRNTIAKILPVYAPAGDNNLPTKYIQDVSAKTGISPNKPLSASDLVPVVKAMTRIEKGESLPEGTAEKVFNNIKSSGFFANNPLPYSATETAVNGTTSLIDFWGDKKKRIQFLTVTGLVTVTGLLVYNANKKKKKKYSRR
jgi:hypothetical protein